MYVRPAAVTGRTAPAGAAVLSRATANPTTAANAAQSIDFSSAGVIAGEESIAEAGAWLWQLGLEVASGAKLWSETVLYTPPAPIYAQGPVFYVF